MFGSQRADEDLLYTIKFYKREKYNKRIRAMYGERYTYMLKIKIYQSLIEI